MNSNNNQKIMFMLVARSMSPTRNTLTGIPSTIFEALQYMILAPMSKEDVRIQFKPYHQRNVLFRLGPAEPFLSGRIRCIFKQDRIEVQQHSEITRVEDGLMTIEQDIRVCLHETGDVDRVLFITNNPTEVYFIEPGERTSTKRFLTADGKLRYVAHGFSLKHQPISEQVRSKLKEDGTIKN